MTRPEREHLGKRIVQHYANIGKKKKSITVNQLSAENIPRETIYSIVRKYDDSSRLSNGNDGD